MWLFVAVYAAIAALIGVDQWIKLWAIENLQGQPSRSFLPIGDFDWMHLTYTENTGAAFSMFSGSRAFLIVFPLIMIVVCTVMLHRLHREHRWVLFALPLMIAGGIGNLIDRVFRDGAVVDYLDLQLFDFAIFNFADCCVSVGVVLLMICVLFVEKEEPTAKKLPKARRVPFAREAPPLPEAEMLPDAAMLPDAQLLPEAESEEQNG